MSTKIKELSENLEKLARFGLMFAGGWFLVSVSMLIATLTPWSAAAGWAGNPALLTLLLISGALLVGYIFVAAIPLRQTAAALLEIEGQSAAQERSLLEILRRLRLGELAVQARESEALPSQVHQGIDHAIEALASQIQRIQERSLEVAKVGTEVQATSSDLAAGFSQQSAAVIEITATIEELARTAAQISQNAEHQADLADLAETEGNKGAESVRRAVQGTGELSRRISHIAERADSLDSRSKEIYRILDLISEIAHDTHILSLNAAIEAETAGEHGRRFAVVADEVRRLAQRARESVQSVRSHLEEFSSAIRSTVVATEEGSKEAAQVLEQAQASQGAIEQLRSAISATSLAAQEISLATKEQRTASDQVATTIKEVREVIQRMADALRNFYDTAKNLNELALAIQLITQGFRFDAPRSLKNVFHQRAARLSALSDGWEGIDGELRELLKRCPYVEFCYLVDADGTMLACTSSPEWSREQKLPEGLEVGKKYVDRPWFKTVHQTGGATLTSLYESLMTGQQCFTVAAPVKDSEKRLVAVLGADVNLKGWIKI